MSGLYRDKGVTYNFFGMCKVREDSRNKREMKRTHKGGTRPPPWVPAPVAWPIGSHLVDPASTVSQNLLIMMAHMYLSSSL
jgi:hypothetical protein